VGQCQVGDRGDPTCRNNTVGRATGQFFVGLAGQKDRIVQFHCGRRYPTNNADRPADGVYAFIECGEYLGITPIDDVIVDRQHSNGLGPVPVILVELDILAQLHCAITVDHGASHRRYRPDGRKNRPLVRKCLNGHHGAVYLDVIQTRAAFSDALIICCLNAGGQRGRKRRKAVVRRDGLGVYRAGKGDRPAFADCRDAGKFDFQHVVKVKVRNNAGHDCAACIRGDRCLNKETRRRQTAVAGDGDCVLGQHGVVARQPVERRDQAVPHTCQRVPGYHRIGRGEQPGLIVDIVVQIDGPDFPRDHRPGQRNLGEGCGDADLHPVRFAKVSRRVKGEITVVGPCLERSDIDRDPLIANQLARQNDIKRVSDAHIALTALGKISRISALDDFDRRCVVVQQLQVKRCGDQLFLVFTGNVVVVF